MDRRTRTRRRRKIKKEAVPWWHGAYAPIFVLDKARGIGAFGWPVDIGSNLIDNECANIFILLAHSKGEDPDTCMLMHLAIELIRMILAWVIGNIRYCSLPVYSPDVSMKRLLIPWNMKYAALSWGRLCRPLFNQFSESCAHFWIPPLDQHDGKPRDWEEQVTRYRTYSMGWFVNRFGSTPCLVFGKDMFESLTSGKKILIGDGTRPVLCIAACAWKDCEIDPYMSTEIIPFVPSNPISTAYLFSHTAE